MAEFESDILTIDTVKAAEMYPAASSWFNPPSEQSRHTSRFVTALVSDDGKTRYSSAQQRILAAGGIERVGRAFDADLARGDYGPFTLYMAARPTTAMDIYTGAVMLDSGGDSHSLASIYETRDQLLETGLLQPAGDIVVLSRNVKEPGRIAVFQDMGFQTTPSGIGRLQEARVIPRRRGASGNLYLRGRHS